MKVDCGGERKNQKAVDWEVNGRTSRVHSSKVAKATLSVFDPATSH